MTARRAADASLRRLAQLYGVQTAFYDNDGKRHDTEPERLLPVLRALGAPLENEGDAADALRERRLDVWRRVVEPVVVAWDGGPAAVALRLPASRAGDHVDVDVTLENGERRRFRRQTSRLPVTRSEQVEGERFVERRLGLPRLPAGYHRLRVRAGRVAGEALIVSAPTRAYSAFQRGDAWGVFLPLYALRTERDWGAGDLTDLESLLDWVAGLGGQLVATLPLLASYLDRPFNPSPYVPVSRLFWNEMYVDPSRLPELASSRAARRTIASPAFESAVLSLRRGPLVDHKRLMALKRGVLEQASRTFFAGRDGRRQREFRAFVRSNQAVEDYARFRAAVERRGVGWPRWPARMRDGGLARGDYDEAAVRYHLYAQWAADEQLRRVSEAAGRNGQQMYLDLPLGVHEEGYDTWRHRDVFAAGVWAGAPPDAFFTGGQNWGFPPLQPERLRERGYDYVIAYLRHHLRYARVLRIDHVMGLHRLYWIPHGYGAAAGVYVRYPAEELYAILSLESHRHRATIVGENLGTVPFYVNPTMSEHRIYKMYVSQFSMSHKPGARALRPVPPDAVASLSTHDLPTFAALWEGRDVQTRRRLRLLDGKGAKRELRERDRLRRSVSRYLRRGRGRGPLETSEALNENLAYLSRSGAAAVLVNLEDLWGETESQNIPGTWKEHPNWQRKGRYRLDEFATMPGVVDTLGEVNRLRKGRRR